MTSVATDQTQQTAGFPRSKRAEREVQRNSALRQARTCYGHLAGVAGMELVDSLLADGLLELDPANVDGNGNIRFVITTKGQAQLGPMTTGPHREPRDLDVAHVPGCLDWTERRPHLGGAFGRALTAELERCGAITRQSGGRTVQVMTPVDEALKTLLPRLPSA